MMCFTGTCEGLDAWPKAGPGESCRLSSGALCSNDDLTGYCGRDGTCRERVALGEACDVPTACDDWGRSTYCAGISPDDDAEGTCVETTPLGGACDPTEPTSPCAENGYCALSGACTTWPAVCYMVADEPGGYAAGGADWIPR
jgi:hypothetical protein